MLELRQELVSLLEWEEADFECPTQAELDAVALRILRMAELLRRMREISERKRIGETTRVAPNLF